MMTRLYKRKPWWFFALTLPLARAICTVLLSLYGPARWRHRRNIPRKGPLIILANHNSDCDPVLMQWACRRHINFMAKADLWEMKSIRRLLDLFAAFPVEQGRTDKSAIEYSLSVLKDQQVLCIFPEGKLSEDGSLQPLQPGSALVIRMSGAPVMCCGLINTQKIRPYGGGFGRAGVWVDVNFGPVRSFERTSSPDEIMEWARTELLRLTRQG